MCNLVVLRYAGYVQSPSKELFLGSEIGMVNKSAARLLHTKWRIIPASQEKLFCRLLYVYARMPPILICFVLSPPRRRRTALAWGCPIPELDWARAFVFLSGFLNPSGEV